MNSVADTNRIENNVVFQRRNPVRNHFVNTSKVLLYGYKSLSDNAKITYQVIDGFDWEDKDTGDSKGYAFPATETLAVVRNVSRRTIERHIAELEQVGLLTRQQRRNLPSILIIEDVSEAEIGEYLKQVQRGRQATEVPTRKKPSRQAKAEAVPTETKNVTIDKNVVSPERQGTTKTSVAYNDERKRNEEQQQVVAKLREWHIGEVTARAVSSRYTLAYVEEKLVLLRRKLEGTGKGQPIIDTASWLLSALEHNYHAAPEWKRTTQTIRAIVEEDPEQGIMTIVERTPDRQSFTTSISEQTPQSFENPV